MNKAIKRFLLILAVALCISFTAAAEERELLPAQGIVTVQGAAVRPEPTRAVAKLISLDQGTQVTVLKWLNNKEGNWLKVSYKDARRQYDGYILMKYVDAQLSDPDGKPLKIPVSMRVSAKAECGAYNHVGYHWQKLFFIDGAPLNGSQFVALSAGDTMTLSALLSENDAYPDVGRGSVEKAVEQSELNGFTVSFTVTVVENRGRYSGNECVWHVTFRFTKA